MKLDERAFDKALGALATAMRVNPPIQFYNHQTGQVDAIISDYHARQCLEAYLLALQGSPEGEDDAGRVTSHDRDIVA